MNSATWCAVMTVVSLVNVAVATTSLTEWAWGASAFVWGLSAVARAAEAHFDRKREAARAKVR